MRHSLLLPAALCGAFLIACAPASTTQRPESQRDIVTAADIEANPNLPLEAIIQRKVSGVKALMINGVLVLQIRGSTTLSTEEMKPTSANPAPPLFIVDGMRTPAGSSGEMPSVPARDIATIKVLKGADTALYGLDGSNGVVVITTKGH